MSVTTDAIGGRARAMARKASKLRGLAVALEAEADRLVSKATAHRAEAAALEDAAATLALKFGISLAPKRRSRKEKP